MKPVLGEDEFKSNGYIDLKYDKNNNIILRSGTEKVTAC